MQMLEIDHLIVQFRTSTCTVYAVTDISYLLNKCETLAVIGESYSDENVHALGIAGKPPFAPRTTASDQILFFGCNLTGFFEVELRLIPGCQIEGVPDIFLHTELLTYAISNQVNWTSRSDDWILARDFSVTAVAKRGGQR